MKSERPAGQKAEEPGSIHDAWEPEFFRACPAFEVLDFPLREALKTRSNFPDVSEYSTLRAFISGGERLTIDFAVQDKELVRKLGGYDAYIRKTSKVPTRPNSFHDLLNALIWMHFPLLKQELHRRLANERDKTRNPFQNAVCHFDESGMIVLSSDTAVFQNIVQLRWQTLFWDERERTQQTTRFLTFGHGLLDKLRHPFIGLTAKAVFIEIPKALLEAETAELRAYAEAEILAHVDERFVHPKSLRPLPVLGIPTWHSCQSEGFYENAHYFRQSRVRS